MQWGLLTIWGAAVWLGGRRIPRLMAAALPLSMGTQLWLLHMDGLFTLETALPLHLCGLFGVLSIPLLLGWECRPLYEASAFLAGPAAFLTLFFPAVMPCSHPKLMALAFHQLHVLVALTPAALWRNGKPLPTNPRRTLILGSGYLLFIAAFNRAFQTNYLFLRAAPAGTPLSVLFSQGSVFYVCALLMLCMLAFSLLQGLFCRLMEGNSSAYSRYSRCS